MNQKSYNPEHSETVPLDPLNKKVKLAAPCATPRLRPKQDPPMSRKIQHEQLQMLLPKSTFECVEQRRSDEIKSASTNFKSFVSNESNQAMS